MIYDPHTALYPKPHSTSSLPTPPEAPSLSTQQALKLNGKENGSCGKYYKSFIGTAIRIQSFIPSLPEVRKGVNARQAPASLPQRHLHHPPAADAVLLAHAELGAQVTIRVFAAS